MKNQILSKLALTSCVVLAFIACTRGTRSDGSSSTAPSPQLSVDGGSDRGGGNAIGSSADQVKSELTSAMFDFGAIVHLAATDKTNVLYPDNVKNARVKAVLASWFEKDISDPSTEKVVIDTLNTKFQLQTAECPSQTDDDHDASTLHQQGAVICFSSDRLTRFPQWTLRGELIALAAHEYAHHFGYGEDDARAIQAYFFDSYGLIQVQSKLEIFYQGYLENYRSRVKSGYSPAGSPTAISFAKMICRAQASIEGLAAGLNLSWFQRDLNIPDACDPDQFDADAVEKHLRELEARSIQDFNK